MLAPCFTWSERNRVQGAVYLECWHLKKGFLTWILSTFLYVDSCPSSHRALQPRVYLLWGPFEILFLDMTHFLGQDSELHPFCGQRGGKEGDDMDSAHAKLDSTSLPVWDCYPWLRALNLLFRAWTVFRHTLQIVPSSTRRGSHHQNESLCWALGLGRLGQWPWILRHSHFMCCLFFFPHLPPLGSDLITVCSWDGGEDIADPNTHSEV